MTARAVFGAAAVVLLGGCLSWSGNLERVADVDGSNDHRVYRVGELTQIMMEPALWQLEDSERVNFDRPVTLYLKDLLPPEFDRVTLRMLHDGLSGLPYDLTDPWCLGDIGEVLLSAGVGTEIGARYERRANFIRKLWDPRIRGDVRRGEPRPSNIGYALMMMAIEDELGESPEALLQRYVVRPYGLKDTSFELRPELRLRLTRSCAGAVPWLLPGGWEIPDHHGGDVRTPSCGLYSSASDLLKVCFVVLPHLDRARGVLAERRLRNGRRILYRTGATYGGYGFVGFDPKGRQCVVALENRTRLWSYEGLELFESLRGPADGRGRSAFLD